MAVVAAVDALGLRAYRNVDVPTGLRLLLDRAPERYAVIDTGTNSIKFPHHGARRERARTVADHRGPGRRDPTR